MSNKNLKKPSKSAGSSSKSSIQVNNALGMILICMSMVTIENTGIVLLMVLDY